MATANPETVARLMEVMNDALALESEALDASGADVASAVLTMAKATVQACISIGADPANVRHAVEQILVECGSRRMH